ncbi:MAG: hypothetical protein DRP15_03500 [Candidatus Aenigmatarchaeota archaeon]|nr:MAG: hypothetical protein DRP15_03500 [Candidatus Aenigmarchaeota archaeon]
MKVVLIGPLCKDRNILHNRVYVQPGGVVHYTGYALASLGTDTKIFASCSHEDVEFFQNRKYELMHIPKDGTIEFINEYSVDNPDNRTQRAVIPNNQILPEDIDFSALSEADYVVLGPLYHKDISSHLIKELYKQTSAKIVLALQGMIRHLDGEKIVWKSPEIDNILYMIDYLAMDENELKFIAQNDDLYKAARFLQDKGARNLLITQGGKGSKIFIGDEEYNIRAFPPQKLVDPTGAGDTYLAGFIKAKELFDDPVKQGEFAAMTATICIEKHGPFDKSVDDILNRLGWK